MESNLLLSLCIPTNGAAQWVIPTLESIYNQHCDTNLFEVIITDNGDDNILAEALKKYQYPNLYYYKTNAKGFYNLILAMEYGKGIFIKMLNHRSILRPNSIQEILNLITENQNEQPLIYFSDGNLGKQSCIKCNNFESFVSSLSYWSSWSAGISIWQKDMPILKQLEYNKMFPNTSLIFEVRKQSQYLIWNKKYQDLQDDTRKGGYNIFKTFAVDYLDILTELRIKGRIKISTFNKIREDLYPFLRGFYYQTVVCKTQYTFQTENVKEYICLYYGPTKYYSMILWSYFRYPLKKIKSIFTTKLNKVNE